jgi:hypothetical protein
VKSKLKTIIVTFIATTAFWCLVIVGFVWFSCPSQSSTDYTMQLRRLGFHYVVFDQNREGHDTTFVVEALQTNAIGSQISRAELLRTSLMPSQTIMLGLRRER